MNNYTIYALKGSGDSDTDAITHNSLEEGIGRFAWSGSSKADLKQLQNRINTAGWDSLSREEEELYTHQAFLLDIKKNDYVVYVNLPEWGKCTLARVTGSYFWGYDDPDFNHRFPVDPKSIFVFDRNDAIVHPSLSSRLKLRGRYWRIYTYKEFDDLIKALKAGKGGKPRTLETNLVLLKQDIQPDLEKITKKIQHAFPNFDLEGLIEEIFKRIPGVQNVTRHRGKGDRGADLTVVFESGIPFSELPRHHTCVVQVKSFKEEHWDTKAVEDIRRAFDYYPDAEMGLIISTATTSSEVLDNALDKLREKTGKPISLLIGPKVAAFLLRFSADLLD